LIYKIYSIFFISEAKTTFN